MDSFTFIGWFELKKEGNFMQKAGCGQSEALFVRSSRSDIISISQIYSVFKFNGVYFAVNVCGYELLYNKLTRVQFLSFTSK